MQHPHQHPSPLKGVVAPVITPFDEALDPDPVRFAEICAWLLRSGCTGLAPFGTTSEANSLSTQERIDLLEAAVKAGVDASRLVPGTGCCSVTETALLSRHAMETGCAGVMTLPPFYYKGASDEGLYRYFASLIERVGDARLKIYLYHIPPIAQVPLSHELVTRLVGDFPEVVVGLKDSSGDWHYTEGLLGKLPGFGAFFGSEERLLATLNAGGAGCISATANVNAAGIRAVWDAWGTPRADSLQASASAVRRAIAHHPLIPAVKYLLAHYLRDPGLVRVRPPLTAFSEEKGRALVETLERDCAFGLEEALS